MEAGQGGASHAHTLSPKKKVRRIPDSELPPILQGDRERRGRHVALAELVKLKGDPGFATDITDPVNAGTRVEMLAPVGPLGLIFIC